MRGGTYFFRSKMALEYFFRSKFGLSGSKRATVRICASVLPGKAGGYRSRVRKKKAGCPTKTNANIRLPQQPQKGRNSVPRPLATYKITKPDKTNANIRFPNNPKKGGASFRARSPPTKSRNPTKQMRISAFPNNPKKGGASFRARSPRKSNNPTKQCERQIDFYCFFAENELL